MNYLSIYLSIEIINNTLKLQMSSSLKDRLKRSGRCQSDRTRAKFRTPYRSTSSCDQTTPQRQQESREQLNNYVKVSLRGYL